MYVQLASMHANWSIWQKRKYGNREMKQRRKDCKNSNGKYYIATTQQTFKHAKMKVHVV